MISPHFSYYGIPKTSIISMRQRRRYRAANKGGDTGGVVGGAVAETEMEWHQDGPRRCEKQHSRSRSP
ncbi:hypothetical protein DY000_02047190 [Brassica cretica]|uniref:Uncharacterized protein n=1 Tax=Brassica cretica TaxID=69181 RepID=A0ABQ7ETM8_BRACR|nr:hypothetical protein DY000_02047190 [Brassica cretica]